MGLYGLLYPQRAGFVNHYLPIWCEPPRQTPENAAPGRYSHQVSAYSLADSPFTFASFYGIMRSWKEYSARSHHNIRSRSSGSVQICQHNLHPVRGRKTKAAGGVLMVKQHNLHPVRGRKRNLIMIFHIVKQTQPIPRKGTETVKILCTVFTFMTQPTPRKGTENPPVD